MQRQCYEKWRTGTAYSLYHITASYHFSAIFVQYLSEGLYNFRKGYHIEKSVNPSCYQEHLTNFEACMTGNMIVPILAAGMAHSVLHHFIPCLLIPLLPSWVGVGCFSKVVATFNHVGGSFNLFMATTGHVWIIPSFWIWGYVLHVEHISCVIINSDQHQWVIPFPLSIALQALQEENTTRKLLSLSLDWFFKILLFHVAFLIFFSIAIFLLTFFWLGCYCSV